MCVNKYISSTHTQTYIYIYIFNSITNITQLCNSVGIKKKK